MSNDKKSSTDGYNRPFAVRLRRLMDEQKVSQSKVAAHLGITRQAVSTYTLGTSLPDVEKLGKIAELFDVSADFLLGRTEVQSIDLNKQQICKYLDISEYALNMLLLPQVEMPHTDVFGHISLVTNEQESRTKMMSLLFEHLNLQGITHDLYHAMEANQEIQFDNEMPKLSKKEAEAVKSLQKKGYLTLQTNGQVEFYVQSAISTFDKALREILDEDLQ